jgi:hypothetical protein
MGDREEERPESPAMIRSLRGSNDDCWGLAEEEAEAMELLMGMWMLVLGTIVTIVIIMVHAIITCTHIQREGNGWFHSCIYI